MPSSYCRLLYHCVFGTKERRPLIHAGVADELYPFMAAILTPEQGRVLKIGGVKDHVHILLELPTDVHVAEALRVLKANSSRWLNRRGLLDGPFRWPERDAPATQHGVARASQPAPEPPAGGRHSDSHGRKPVVHADQTAEPPTGGGIAVRQSYGALPGAHTLACAEFRWWGPRPFACRPFQGLTASAQRDRPASAPGCGCATPFGSSGWRAAGGGSSCAARRACARNSAALPGAAGRASPVSRAATG